MSESIGRKIKYLSFMMTCLILTYHCPTIEVDGERVIGKILNEIVTGIFNNMGSFAMSYFFAITGYLLFRGLNMKTYGKKIKRRVFSLLVPYVLWQCVFEIKLLILRRAWSLKSFLYNTFALVRWPVDGALWYVYAVFLLALTSPLLILTLKNKRIGGVTTVLLIFGIYLLSKCQFAEPIVSYGYISNILNYIPAYLAGAFLGKLSGEITREEALSLLAITVFISFVIDPTVPGILNTITVRMLPMLLLFIIPEIPCLNDKKIYKLSFLIYAIHQPIISDFGIYIAKICNMCRFPAFLGNIIIRALFLAITVALAFVIYRVLIKFAPKLLGLLTGGRESNY